MSIKKVCGTVAALVLFSGYSSAVFADCATDRADAIEDTQILARALACTDYPNNWDEITGNWDPLNAIWQFRPKKGGNGCEVHLKLNKKLDEAPQKDPKPGKGKSTIDSRGAAALLEDFKDQNAFDMLQQFMDTIMYNAKLNRLYVGTTEFPTKEDAAQYFVDQALLIQNDVGDLMVCTD